MKTIGAYEAKTNFSKLLEAVGRGEEITITKHGVPVARLVPAERRRSTEEFEALLREMDDFREAHPLDGLRVKDLIEEGRHN
ncbi:MAG: type II toxin-antitoxin system prevent-host-death family antitoxin [Dehalococcoidia bacterium]|nr:type II toxin-antitoxin system prevent-host-death family antitoxin [Dehalococcoidia bacterium]